MSVSEKSRSGLSQAEVSISTIIVGVLMVTSFSTIAASRRSQVAESNRIRGLAIAESMIAEITQLPMRDQPCDCGFGPGTSELGTDRSDFDDVDDYRNLVDSPPKSRAGITLNGYTSFTRTVSVDRVSSTNWNSVVGTYAGVYRITVVVRVGSSEVCRLVTYRTSGSSGASSLAGFSSTN
ncbi:MAG: hypothetical protein NTW52_03510 [Planctomycetota bacterium]|nr:hypothetical protein [Planctomycetota bacterium]